MMCEWDYLLSHEKPIITDGNVYWTYVRIFESSHKIWCGTSDNGNTRCRKRSTIYELNKNKTISIV